MTQLKIDKNGNLEGVTGLRQITEGDEEWTFESVAGWFVHSNKFVASMNGIEITFTEKALENILQALRTSPQYRVEV